MGMNALSSGLAESLRHLKSYGIPEAKKDIEIVKDLNFGTCEVGKTGSYGGIGGTTDKFVQMLSEKHPELAKLMENSPKIDRALSFMPSSIFRPNRLSQIVDAMVGRSKVSEQQMKQMVEDTLRNYALESALEDNLEAVKKFAGKGETKVSTILETILTAPEGKVESFLNGLRIAIGGTDFDETSGLLGLETLAKQVATASVDSNGQLTDAKLAVKVAQIRHKIRPDAALVMSTAYYLAAKRGATCTEGVQTLKGNAALYMERARLWANIARMAKDPENAIQHIQNEQKFVACNTALRTTAGSGKAEEAKRSDGFVQLANALINGSYECSGEKFIDTTFTKLYPPVPGLMPSRMMCTNDNATVHFSRAENAVVALWHSARLGAEGCFGKLTGGGGVVTKPVEKKCEPGYRKRGKKCKKIWCGRGSVPYKKCPPPPPPMKVTGCKPWDMQCRLKRGGG